MLQCPKRKELIHMFRRGNRRYLFSRENLAVFEIDEPTWDVLNHCDCESNRHLIYKLKHKYDETSILEILEEIGTMEEQGLIFVEPNFSFPSPFEEAEPPPIHTINLNITHACNLKCGYCVAGKGSYGGPKILMKATTARNAIDFLFYHSKDEQTLQIQFFGGEPLLNYPVIQEAVTYSKGAKETGKRVKYELSTNITLLNEEILEFLIENKFGVNLSIDGTMEVHDQQRQFIDGRGSYEACISNLKPILEGRVNSKRFSARATYTAKTLNFSDSIRHLAELGFKDIAIEPAFVPEDSDLRIQWSDLEKIREELNRLADYYLECWQSDERKFYFGGFDNLLCALESGARQLQGCIAGIQSVAVDAVGNIYPCHGFVNLGPAYQMGNVNQGTYNNRMMREIFKVWYTDSRQMCRNCWAKYLCPAACYYYWIVENGELGTPYQTFCEIAKMNAETAMMVFCELSKASKEQPQSV